MKILIAIIFIAYLIYCSYCLYSSSQIKKKAEEIKVEKFQQQKEIENLKNKLQTDITLLENKKNSLTEQITAQQTNNDLYCETEKKRIKEIIDNHNVILSKASEQYVENLEHIYSNAENDYKNKMRIISADIDNANNELQKLKDSLTAGIAAQLREKEKEEQSEFYTLQLDEKSKNEVKAIKGVEHILSDPRPLRMLIWTTYYSKKANELCSRVIGNKKVIGIYKITNLLTKQVYIGQSKDIKERWREHMKCGLGIDTPAGNKLYKSMLNDGLDNFTFELLEECSANDLNEKETLFIDLYSSYDFGYNSNTGIKKK